MAKPEQGQSVPRLMQRCASVEKAGERVASVVSSPQPTARTGQYFEHKPERLSVRELDPEHQHQAWQLGHEMATAAPTNLRANSRTVSLGKP
jgi:hypothetical protein